MKKNLSYKVVCFGEILWDVLPKGALPGGAPMNVAYHLKKLGIEPALITRIGLDNWGKDLMKMMEKNNISTSFFQTDDTLETGKVNATINENREVSYEILKPVAWDNIRYGNKLKELVYAADCFVFGSLATRSDVTRSTLFKLIEAASYKILDINLRAPHYSRYVIEQLLYKINLLKLNEAELELITGWFANYRSDIDRLKVLQDKFYIKDIVVTKGKKGSLFNRNGKIYDHPGYKITVTDTIGSGDSFLAALLSKLLNGNTVEEALEFASATGALIASYPGACPDYHPSEIMKLIKRDTVQHMN